MKKLIIGVLIGSVFGICNAQYNYGLEVSEQDVKIDGRVNLTYGNLNTIIGESSGININTETGNFGGSGNTLIGSLAGSELNEGWMNTFIGVSAGKSNIVGQANTFVGYLAGTKNIGNNNTFLGRVAGHENVSGQGNVFLGQAAGYGNFGSNNIFIGTAAGSDEIGSNQLFIENSNSLTPLIYGDFEINKIQINGSFHVTDFARLKPISDAPTSPEIGTIYYNSNDNKVKVWTGSIWENLN